MWRYLNKKRCGIALICVIVIILLPIILFSKNKTKKAEKQLALAAEYLEELDYEQAVAMYISVLEIDPKNIDAIYGLGDAYIAWTDTMETPDEQLALISEALMKIKELFHYQTEEYQGIVCDFVYKISDIYQVNDKQDLAQEYRYRGIDIGEAEVEYVEIVLDEILAELPEEIKQLESERLEAEQKENEIQEKYQLIFEELIGIVDEGDPEKILETISRSDYIENARNLEQDIYYIGEKNEEGQRDGKGLAIYNLSFTCFETVCSNPVYYYGEWSNGMRNGKGYWFFSWDNYKYEKGPLDDIREGFFELEWVNDVPNGTMKYWGRDGYVAEGQVVDGLFDGEMKATVPHNYVQGIDLYTKPIDIGPVEVIYQFDHGKVQPIREEGWEYVVAETETEYGPVKRTFYEEAVKRLQHGVLGYGEAFWTLE